MLKKFFQWFLSLFRKSSIDSLEGYVPKSSVKRGSDVKPDKLVIPRLVKPCPVCSEPMHVSIGQIVFSHRFNSKGMPCRYASRHGGYVPSRMYVTA